MRRVSTQPLRRQLLVWLALFLGPILAAATWAGWVAYREGLSDLHTEAVAIVAILTFGLIGLALVAMVVSRQLVRSVSHLESAARRVASGDLRPLERQQMPTSELTSLQDAFDLMVQRLDEARQAIDRQVTEERQVREELQSLQRQVIRQERVAAGRPPLPRPPPQINKPPPATPRLAQPLPIT